MLDSRLADFPALPSHLLSAPFAHPIHFLPIPYNPVPICLRTWSALLGPDLSEEERKWEKRGSVVLRQDGAYGFGDEVRSEVVRGVR